MLHTRENNQFSLVLSCFGRYINYTLLFSYTGDKPYAGTETGPTTAKQNKEVILIISQDHQNYVRKTAQQ